MNGNHWIIAATLLVLIGMGWGSIQPSAGETPAIELSATESAPVSYFHKLTEARKLYWDGQHAEALPLLEALSAVNPDDGFLWLATGDCRNSMNQFRAAADAYRRAHELGAEPPAETALLMARAFARAAESDSAL